MWSGKSFLSRHIACSLSTQSMCVSAVVNPNSTTTYILQSTGKFQTGWMAMYVTFASAVSVKVYTTSSFSGFGTQMANSPMVITWANPDGSVTLSQRSAPGQVMPTQVMNPARVATLFSELSNLRVSNNPKMAFSIPVSYLPVSLGLQVDPDYLHAVQL
jgi:hypothetical protein